MSRNPSGVSTGRLERLGPSREKPLGEWNSYDITVAGDTITLAVNGEEVNRMTGVTPAAGFIALQTEGTPIDFRNVTLTPLPPAKDLNAPMPSWHRSAASSNTRSDVGCREFCSPQCDSKKHNVLDPGVSRVLFLGFHPTDSQVVAGWRDAFCTVFENQVFLATLLIRFDPLLAHEIARIAGQIANCHVQNSHWFCSILIGEAIGNTAEEEPRKRRSKKSSPKGRGDVSPAAATLGHQDRRRIKRRFKLPKSCT